MMKNIFVSTGAFNTSNLSEIIDIAHKQGLNNLELTANISQESYAPEILHQAPSEMRFFVHNYFPPEPTDLVLNLASENPQIRDQSLSFCKQAIDLCVDLKCPVYSVHAGFCCDPAPEDLGQSQTHLKRQSKQAAQSIFENSLLALLTYAQKKKTELCIENNVVPEWNLIDGQNELDLMVEPEDYRAFMQNRALENVRFLLDAGHLKVSAKALQFDPRALIEQAAPRIDIWHLSDNDGRADTNRAFDKNAWFLPVLKDFPGRTYVLEAYGLHTDTIHRCVELIHDAVCGNIS